MRAPCGAGVVSIREAARWVNRDVKAVHGDVTALVKAGVLLHRWRAATAPQIRLSHCANMR